MTSALLSLPPMVLLIISLGITLAYTVLRNRFSKGAGAADLYLFNLLSCMASVLVFLLSGGFPRASLPTVLLGIVFGILTALAAIFQMQALRLGPMSYTTMITTASMIIPALSGRLFWQEPVSAWGWIGMALMLCSVLLSVERGGGDEKRGGLRWLLFALAAMLATGAIGVLQKLHQSTGAAEEIDAFLLIAFAVSILYSLILCIGLTARGEKPAVTRAALPSVMGMAAVSGICVALANQINLYLSGKMDSALFFTVVNGGGLMLAVLAGVLIFRERLTRRRAVGLAVGAAAVIFLCTK